MGVPHPVPFTAFMINTDIVPLKKMLKLGGWPILKKKLKNFLEVQSSETSKKCNNNCKRGCILYPSKVGQYWTWEVSWGACTLGGHNDEGTESLWNIKSDQVDKDGPQSTMECFVGNNEPIILIYCSWVKSSGGVQSLTTAAGGCAFLRNSAEGEAERRSTPLSNYQVLRK